MSTPAHTFTSGTDTGFYSMTKTSWTGTTGNRCGQQVVQRGPTTWLLAHEGWQEQNEAFVGYCDMNRGHGGTCIASR